MDVTIVVHDNIVIVDGVARRVDCSAVDQMVRIVRWDGAKGWVEFHNDPLSPFNRNGRLTKAADFVEFQPVLAAWQTAASAYQEPGPPVIGPTPVPEDNPDPNYARPVFPP